MGRFMTRSQINGAPPHGYTAPGEVARKRRASTLHDWNGLIA